jgi:hypothetical protein
MPLDREDERRRVQARLEESRGLAERNRLGQFATPPTLALDIARYVWGLWGGRGPVRFLEPGLGTGAFYSALRQVVPADQVACALGLDIDEDYAHAARGLWGEAGLEVVQADFTRQSPPSKLFNLILGNPPYVRHHHITPADKVRLRKLVSRRLGLKVSGLSGLYCYFLLLADAWLADGGLAAWLVPSEFLDVNYGRAVKDYLSSRTTLLRVHRFPAQEVQFGDALVTSTVVVYEKTLPPESHAVQFSLGGSVREPISSTDIPIDRLRAANKWPARPRTTSTAQPETTGATLGDLFTIKRGIATGANSFFILDRQEARQRQLPEEFLRPILPSSRWVPGDVIEADGDGYPKLVRSLALIDCPLPEQEVRDRYPALWDYLAAGKRQQLHKGYLASRRRLWYAQERREPPPFLCTYMGRLRPSGNPFRFFWNKSRAVAPNVYLLLYPRGVLKGVLDSRPELHGTVLAELHSLSPDRLIGEGRVYGGGLHKLEPRELAALPAQPLLDALGIDSVHRQPLLFP